MFKRTPLIPAQLTKEEEASAGSEDMEVRREDQEKINKFSSLHQKETNLEEELRAKIVSAVIHPVPLPTALNNITSIASLISKCEALLSLDRLPRTCLLPL